MYLPIKVEKFLECIKACEGSTNANDAILMAQNKYYLNAACVEDQDAWFEAVALAGYPFSRIDWHEPERSHSGRN